MYVWSAIIANSSVSWELHWVTLCHVYEDVMVELFTVYQDFLQKIDSHIRDPQLIPYFSCHFDISMPNYSTMYTT